jgi:hypothetical protein
MEEIKVKDVMFRIKNLKTGEVGWITFDNILNLLVETINVEKP